MNGKHKIFVYGTLRRGECRWPALEHSEYLGEAVTEASFELADLGPFPGLVRGGATPVVGECYRVDDATLARLDTIEQHPRFYVREAVKLADGTMAMAYLLNQEQTQGAPRIASGDWVRHRAAREGCPGAPQADRL
ncbi:MAG: gamma-glutamylcyclotransferase [Candidatus Schekmanbacteria bacterium]|nr:gamma-glutamylcyclotransferase [Candidatus Schekmanbacteria bacterium]